MAKPPTVDEIKRNLREADGRGEEYVFKSGPGGFEIQADGADDHERAMDALANIGRIAPGAFLPASTTAPPQPIKRIALIDAKPKWEKAIKNTDPKTIGAKRRALDDLIEWKQGLLDAEAAEIGGPGTVASPVLVDEIENHTCGEWFIYLNSRRKFDKKKKLEVPYYSPGTMENKFIYAGVFFDWAMANGHYPKGDNPAKGHANVAKKVKAARAGSHGAQPFDPDQIELMFQPVHYATMQTLASRWAPLLLLFTGARSNEIGRLELADIYEYPKGCKPGTGTKILSFSMVGEDKSLKNDDSARKTPVHPQLLAVGFWDYVERQKAAHKRAQEAVKEARKAKVSDEDLAPLLAAEKRAQKLFSGLTFDAQNGPANATQRAFSRMLAKIGIEARGKGKVGHHSFRDTVINTMKQSGVPKDFRTEYTGHENEVGETAGAYEQQYSPAKLAETVHPVLNWSLDIQGLRPLLIEGAAPPG